MDERALQLEWDALEARERDALAARIAAQHPGELPDVLGSDSSDDDASTLARAAVAFRDRHAPHVAISEQAIRMALTEAHHLADDVYDEPVTLLYALGRNARCFSGDGGVLTVLAVLARARALGFRISARPAELARVASDVTGRRIDFDGVRAQLGEAVWPYGG